MTLYSSLAATGRGHLTDVAIRDALGPAPVDFNWLPEVELPRHPNGMEFQAVFSGGAMSEPWQVFSVGGGALAEEGDAEPEPVYDLNRLADILGRCRETGQSLWEYVEEHEGKEIWTFLARICELPWARPSTAGSCKKACCRVGSGVARQRLGDSAGR